MPIRLSDMNVPRHIAIIMDGNGRWAQNRRLPKIMGHKAGVKTVEVITEACARKGIEALTLYSFSTENWKRPREEVGSLMSLFEKSMADKWRKIHDNNIRFNVIGRVHELSSALQKEIDRLKDLTRDNTGMVLSLAINYGGRQEIIDGVRAALTEIRNGELDEVSLNEELFSEYLYTRGLPDPDFVIRTSGEMRLSNFLLWQTAYSEIYVTDVLWPDFGIKDLDEALEEFGQRERRFGG